MVQVLLVVLAAAPVLAAIWGIAQSATSFRKSCELQAFLVFTERYDQIMQSVQTGAEVQGADLDRQSQLRYLNLCSEEFHLHREKLITPGLWFMWRDELRRRVLDPGFGAVWTDLRAAFDGFPDFQALIEDLRSGVA